MTNEELEEKMREMDNILTAMLKWASNATDTEGFILSVLQSHHRMLGQIMKELDIMVDIPDIQPKDKKENPIQ